MTQTFSIHGVILDLTSADKGFSDFAHEYLKGFEIGKKQKADINVHCEFLGGFTVRTNQEKYAPHTLGSGLGWDGRNNTLYINQREIEARVTLTEPWHAEVTFKKNFFRHFANTFLFAGSKTQHNYYRATLRMITQQLVFMQLAVRWNLVPLSGAAVKFGGKAYVFAGLPGSGKSTLAMELKKHLGAEILAENFVLTDGERLFPFSEGHCSDVAPVPIAGLYVLTHGENFVRYDLPREQAYHALLAINGLTAELPEHGHFGALMLVDPTRWQFLFDSDHETLKKLCERHACARLIADNGLSATIEHFKKI